MLKPCGRCGRPREKFTYYCQFCGHTLTLWVLIAFSLLGGLVGIVLGVGAFVSFPADLPSATRTQLNLVTGCFVLVGLGLLSLSVISISDSVKGRRRKRSTGATRKERYPFGEVSARGPEAGRLVLPDLWAFMAQGPLVISRDASDQDLVEEIRQEAAERGLGVGFFPPEEWDPPPILFSQSNREFPIVVSRAQAHMTKMGLPPQDRQELIRTAAVKTNPLTGTLFFVFRAQRPVHTGEEGPTDVGQDSDGRLQSESDLQDSRCYICGKAVHEGPRMEVVSIPLSGGSDPLAALQGSVERIFARKLVCVSCHRVFCRECGGEDCLEMGPEQALCPNCAQR